MAVQRAASPALRWVALFLVGCAGLGLTLGFRDQIRRNPPAWYTGGREKPVTGAGLIEAKDAVPLDSVTTRPTLQIEDEEEAKPKAEEPKKAEEETAADPLTATPLPGGTETAAAAPRPKPATVPPPKIEPPSEDPVGDLLDAQKKAPETPPTVPY